MRQLELTTNAQNEKTVPENPRFFGANSEETNHESEEVAKQADFVARWWPGEMQQRMPPRKPR